MTLIVEDVDAFVTRAAANGVEVRGRDSDSPIGQLAFLKDLYGDVITIASPSTWATLRR